METNKTSAIPNFTLKALPNDEITEDIDYLNSKQRDAFNVVHTWLKDYVKYDGHYFESVHIFLLHKGWASKSHLVKVVYNTPSQTYWVSIAKILKKTRLGPTETLAINIGGTTIHSGLETSKTSIIHIFLPKILPEKETTEGINSLNLKQSEVFNVAHT